MQAEHRNYEASALHASEALVFTTLAGQDYYRYDRERHSIPGANDC